MAETSWLDGLHPLVRALLIAVSGMGGVGVLGLILDKLWPSAKDRMEDARVRRVEDDETIVRLEARIQDLERERDEAKERAYVERETRIAEKQKAATTMIELELLRSKLQMGSVVLPEDVEQDRAALPPGQPLDDRNADD